MSLGVEGTSAQSSLQPAGSPLWHSTAWPGCRPGVYEVAPFPGTFPRPPSHTPPSLEKQIPTSCLFPNKLQVSAHCLSSPTRSARRGRPTTARNERRQDSQDAAGDLHAQGQ